MLDSCTPACRGLDLNGGGAGSYQQLQQLVQQLPQLPAVPLQPEPWECEALQLRPHEAGGAWQEGGARQLPLLGAGEAVREVEVGGMGELLTWLVEAVQIAYSPVEGCGELAAWNGSLDAACC